MCVCMRVHVCVHTLERLILQTLESVVQIYDLFSNMRLGFRLGVCYISAGIRSGFCKGSARILLNSAEILLGFCKDSA